MAGAPPAVTLALHPENDLYHLSTLLTGLIALRQSGEISLSVSVEPRHDPAYGAVYRLLARCGTSAVRCTIDVADRSDFWDVVGFRQSDVYLKRSYWPTRLPAGVRPFGLNYASRPPGLPAMAIRMLWSLLRRGAARGLRAYLHSPPATTLEWPPEATREPKIVFQSRLWEGAAGGPDVDRINDERISLARALRRTFGNRFLGGIIRTAVAERLCPDAISPLPSRHGAYARWSRAAAIGVYTRGLHDSIAFKLPEYFANGKAVVAQGIPRDIVLPAPLTAGREYVAFSALDDCVATCEGLLTHPRDARGLGEAAWEYYRCECAPTAMARRVVRTMGLGN
ncbi:MAG TPA: hypothetical protein VK124_08465 [Gemmatimonadales bacterium]|nr:hypothetical protein [Gemmatimonadales bacterium]